VLILCTNIVGFAYACYLYSISLSGYNFNNSTYLLQYLLVFSRPC